MAATPNMEADDPEEALFCPTCRQPVDEVEEISGSLICLACGTALEDIGLVHQRHLATADEAGPAEGFGVRVGHHDTGHIAGAALRSQTGGAPHALQPSGRRAADVRAQQSAISAGVTAARLPPGVARDASELLPAVAGAYSQNGKHVMQATLAATVYLAARNLMHGVSLGEVGAAFGVNPLDVGRHYKVMLQLMQMSPPPPRLQALIIKHASILLPRTFPEHEANLRSHPVVKMARDLGDLLVKVEALEGRSPQIASAALLALAYSAHGGAKSASAAADVSTLLGFDRKSVVQHMRHYEEELEKLAPLLPFAEGAGAVELVPYAPLLLRLHDVAARAQGYAAMMMTQQQQQQQQVQA